MEPNRAAGEDPSVMSASQINVWHECKRKWAWRYVARIKPEPHKSAALGSKVHAQLEKYLETGEMPDFVEDSEAANIAASGLHLLPKPGPDLEVEKHFKFQSPATGIWYRGFIDLIQLPAGDRDPVILDHKTTSDLKWAKTPEDLLTDTQAMIYTKAAFLRWPEAPKVTLQWTYFQTRKTRKSLPVIQEVTREHVDYMFPLIDFGAQEIVTTLHSKTQPLDLPPNPRACAAFGGCPYTAQCNLSPEETLRSMSNADAKTEGFLSRLSGEETTAPAASGFDLLSLIGGTPPAEDRPLSDTEVPAPPEDKIPAAFLPKSEQPINPPEFQPPPASSTAVEQAAAQAPTPPTEEKPKRGRPKGSKNKPADVTITEGTAVDVPVGEPKNITVIYNTAAAETGRTDSSAPNTMNAPRAEGFTLYIDCFPVGKRAVMLSKLVAEAQAEITKRTGKADYRMVEYGQGAALLSGLVADAAGTDDIVLDSRTPEGNVCKEALMAKAALVVMGSGR